MKTQPDQCPHCGNSLLAGEIPEESRQHYGDATHFRREIGVEVQGVYDGVLYWQCPDCEGAWQRFPKGDVRHTAAMPYIDHQKPRLLSEAQRAAIEAILPAAGYVKLADLQEAVGEHLGSLLRRLMDAQPLIAIGGELTYNVRDLRAWLSTLSPSR